MSERVLSTPQAQESINRFQQIVNGPLLEQINALHREGQTLSDPNVWDGRLASEFRGNWSETNRRLNEMRQSLEELRRQVATINKNIMQAGGNS